MNKPETQQLLEAIAAVDNRKINSETLDAWFQILKHIPLEIALEAHLMARRAESVGYLEPKHILAFAREAAYALDRQKPKQPEPPREVSPHPICRDHNKRILDCDPCSRRIWKYGEKADSVALHKWATAEIYR